MLRATVMGQQYAESLSRFRNQILVTDVLSGLAQLPDESIDCVITSPPYWGLRDYGIEPVIWDAKEGCKHEWQPYSVQQKDVAKKRLLGDTCVTCNAWRGSLGLEPTIELYLVHLVNVFDEIKRVLKPTGTCWINLGDCYAGAWGLRRREVTSLGATVVPQKSLSLIPHRFAIRMLDRGWILRNHIVWYKPNHMPASVRDRFANAWDHVFFFVKESLYYFDLDAVRVPLKTLSNASRSRMGVRRTPQNEQQPKSATSDVWEVPPETRRLGAIMGDAGAVKIPGGAGWTGHPPGGQAKFVREQDPRWLPPNGKNPGDCWQIPSQASPYAHFATFPERLVEMPIKAGCPLLVCAFCGAPKREIRIRPPNPKAFDMQYRDAKAGYVKQPGRKSLPAERVEAYNDREYTSRGGQFVIAGGCECEQGFVPGIVLDPFMGTGTTTAVSQKLHRDCVGLEINPSYAEIAKRRIALIASA